MIKPDGVQRGVIGNIISRFEQKGYLLKGLKLITPPKSLLEEHYESLKTKVSRLRVIGILPISIYTSHTHFAVESCAPSS